MWLELEPMKIPLEIVDHIFSFLITDPVCLVACSDAHPTFSRLVEKHRYYHTIIHTGSTHFKPPSLEPSYLTKLLSDKPRIANFVRVLHIELAHRYRETESKVPYLRQVASILPMFPLLECLVLSTPYRGLITVSWEGLPQSFRKAVEDCLCLPTLHEVHIGLWEFPLSMLDGHTNIDCFSLCGTPKISKFADTTYPQLKSLSVEVAETFRDQSQHHTLSTAWAIQHISKLHSLKYDYTSNETILELVEICSDTLVNLDLTLGGSRESEFATTYDYRRGTSRPNDIPSLASKTSRSVQKPFSFVETMPSISNISASPSSLQPLKFSKLLAHYNNLPLKSTPTSPSRHY